MLKRSPIAICLLLFSSIFASAQQLSPADSAAANNAMNGISADAIRATMRFLSDPLLQGRGTGTTSYDIAARYAQTQLEALGLKAGGVNGSWYQPVPLRKAVLDQSKSSMTLIIHAEPAVLTPNKDYVMSGSVLRAVDDVDAGVVYVGFGVTAPEANYDDYAGVDVKGKIVLILDGAPSRFSSTLRAYYSDEVVKTKNAVARGAVGILVMLSPEDQKREAWDWIVPQVEAGDWEWLAKDGVPHNSFPEIHGGALLSQSGAEKLFIGAPKTLAQVFAAGDAGQPLSFALPVAAHIHTVSNQQAMESSNILGVLRGSDPSLRDQYVVYTAHLDHLGICPPVNGDNVCHGSLDNASGVASLLEIARAFTSLPKAPRRSVLFIVLTGEELGLLGSDYFAHFPTVPLPSIVANINMDVAPGLYYSMQDVVPLGSEHSTLSDNIESAAQQLGYKVSPDPMPEEVEFIRSDQYSFVLQGVPAVQIEDGIHSTDPNVDGLKVIKAWLVTKYHTPLDNMDQPLNYESGAKATKLNFLVGYEVAQQNSVPAWNQGDFFGQKFGSRHSGTAGED